MKFFSFLTIIFFFELLPLSACKDNEDMRPEEEPEEEPVEYDWAGAADGAQAALVREYWSAQHYFNQNNNNHEGFNYWWNAHALDVLVDGYNRTKDPQYIARMEALLEGCRVKNGNTMWNTFYDDMEWMGLACLRAYQATGDEFYKNTAIDLWGWIKKGWSDVKNGGIAWASGSPDSKNACSNAPAAILAARLYQIDGNPDDLAWAKKIYAWMKEYVVEPARGVVWDAYGNYNESNIYTYNQGTYIGAGLELYNITKEEPYLKDAIRTANYVVNDRARFSPGGILRGENSGDGGLFKGIFIRYLVQVVKCSDVDVYTRDTYMTYLEKNGISLWTKATMKPEILFGHTWSALPSGTTIDCSIHLSAVMLIEALNELKI